MPIYSYKGYRENSSSSKGVIEAESKRDAALLLKEKGILASEIKKSTSKNDFFRAQPKSELPLITRELGALLSSGVSLSESLKTLSLDQKSYWRDILIGLKDRISEGSNLAKAMKDFKNLFPEYYINMVASGEASGKLGEVFVGLADFLDIEAGLKAKMKTVLIYPAIMFSTGIIIIGFVMTFVIPRIARVFEASNTALPFATEILITLSTFFANYWIALFGTAILAGYVGRWFARNRRQALDKFILKMPIRILNTLFTARFSRMLGVLFASGVPIVKALELSAASVGNRAFEEHIKTSSIKISSGASISSALIGFPHVFNQIIASSEKTGKLAIGLKKVASIYEDSFNRMADRLLSTLEPVIILIMGAVVGFIAFAIMLPMFQMERLIG